MEVSDQAVKELVNKCGVAEGRAREFLEKAGGDVDAAIARLIDDGWVKADMLNPDTVSDELYERAAFRGKVEFFRQSMNPRAGLAGLMSNLPASEDPGGMLKGMADKVAEMRKQLIGDKTPEQLAAESEADRRKRFEEAKRMGFVGADAPFPTLGMQARDRAKLRRRDARLKANPVTLNLPPFPPLELDTHDWKGKDVLSAWVGCYTRDPHYDDEMNEHEKANANGSFEFEIPRLDEDDENPRPPAPEQVAAYAYLKEHQVELRDKVLDAFVKLFHKVRKQWLEHDPDLELPAIETIDDVKENLLFQCFYMHPYAKDGVAYTGLSFACTWDEEHGAGVLLHKDRIIDIGQAEQGFRTEPCERDGGEELK